MAARPGRILVVDDSREVQLVLRTALSSLGGYSVLTAGDVDAAFEIVQRERPDLVITDILLNGPVGLDLITRIRSDLATDVPSVIACSGFHDYAHEALRRGAHAFLPKPIMIDDLLAAVSAALEDRPLSKATVRELERHSDDLRRRATAKALDVLAAFDSDLPHLIRYMRRGCEFVAGYFDARWAVTALVEKDGFRVTATNDAGLFTEGQRIDEILPFPRNVLESGAVFAIPDADLWSASRVPGGMRFCAGVPFVAAGGVPVGALWLLDPEPRSVDSEDLAILSELGRCAVARLEKRGGRGSAAFTPELLLTRPFFEELVSEELARTRKRLQTFELAVITLERADRGAELAEALALEAPVPRSAVAPLTPATLGVFAVSDDPNVAARAVAGIVDRCRGTAGVAGAAVVCVEPGALEVVRDTPLLRKMEGAAADAARVGEIERFVLRRELREAVDHGATPAP